MSVDPLKKPINRAEQLKTEPGTQYKGVKLYDIDLAIAEHMTDVVVPTVELFNEKVKPPVLYGNPERWKSIKKDGFLKDKDGLIQLPLIVFKRNSIARDESIASSMNRNLFYPSVTMYSKKHKYDNFSLMTGTKRPVEQYNLTMPDYVTVTYDVIIWTDFTEHMNKIVEAFQYATDEYWGNKSGFKFRVRIDSFDNTTEVGDNSQRVVRTSFNMTVHAYLLPEKFDNESTTKKSISPKKVVWGMETDLTGATSTYNKIQMYNEYADVIDYMTIRGSKQGVYVSGDVFKITNVELPICPPELQAAFEVSNLFRIYINGVLIQYQKNGNTLYTYSYNSTTNEIIFTLDSASLGYTIDNTDELGVTGKFIEL